MGLSIYKMNKTYERKNKNNDRILHKGLFLPNFLAKTYNRMSKKRKHHLSINLV